MVATLTWQENVLKTLDVCFQSLSRCLVANSICWLLLEMVAIIGISDKPPVYDHHNPDMVATRIWSQPVYMVATLIW